MKNRPHIVLLGAGASVAAIPHGDINGNTISVMNGFLDKLDMRNIIDSVNLKTSSDNLEVIYSELYEKIEYKHVLLELECKIFDYFSKLQLPNTPTIYDYLLLSLRKKDVVATFNWDPLLLQAYQRVAALTKELPELLFLHGNVGVGICMNHKRGGAIEDVCPVCKEKFSPISLLYPIKKKNYTANPIVKDAWGMLNLYMQKAYILTIFGYSAPTSDYEAINLLRRAWGNSEKRNFEQIEIIDIKSESEIYETWKPFIHSHHYEVHSSFFTSFLARFPRRSCECLFDQTMNCKFLNGEKGLKPSMTSKDIILFFKKIIIDEIKNQSQPLTNFWICP